MQPRDLFGRSRLAAAVILVSIAVALFAVTRFASHSRARYVEHVEQCRLSEDAARGRLWAPTCRGCHDIDSNRPLKPTGGPNLHDVYLALAGTQSLKYGYHYQQPLVAARNAGVLWTDTNLNDYLEGPQSFLDRVTGKHFNQASYMTFFIGGQEPAQVQARRDVIAYLKSIRGRPCS